MNIRKIVLFGPLPIRILAGIAHGMPKLVESSMTQGFFGNIVFLWDRQFAKYIHWRYKGRLVFSKFQSQNSYTLLKMTVKI
ncbi:MAG: hypothetical protein WBL44_11035 [Nitrososphaeraceae archaeon]|jgi:hypothetical protein